MSTLAEQKRSDPELVRRLVHDAISRDLGRRRWAIEAARSGADRPGPLADGSGPEGPVVPVIDPGEARLIVAAHVGVTAGRSRPAGIVALPSPLFAVSIEVGVPAVRLWMNAWSAPTGLHMFSIDTAGLPLAMLALGPQVGTRGFGIGPFASVGLVDFTAGVRGVIHPWTNRGQHRAGLEWRVYGYPGEGFVTGYASLAYSVEVYERSLSQP